MNINKPLSLTSNVGTALNGNTKSPVIRISSENVKISNLKIVANSVNGTSDGIVISKSNNVNIFNNKIYNKLEELNSTIKAYDRLDATLSEDTLKKTYKSLDSAFSALEKGFVKDAVNDIEKSLN